MKAFLAHVAGRHDHHDRLRIFSSSSPEDLNERLVRENQGLLSTSVAATQFLQERRSAPQGAVREASGDGLMRYLLLFVTLVLRVKNKRESGCYWGDGISAREVLSHTSLVFSSAIY
jgi:hypothetical protein